MLTGTVVLHISPSATFDILSQSGGAPPVLHSFPTRRSSDLRGGGARRQHTSGATPPWDRCAAPACREPDFRRSSSVRARSEEHTSELQSQSNLVCRLLLEKKNNYIALLRWLVPRTRAAPRAR